jgi:predicted alpha/beta-fold hydrolase
MFPLLIPSSLCFVASRNTFKNLTIRHNISIPFCVIHALDDPLITWRTVSANYGIMTPVNLTKTGSGNLLILLTKRGGHVGWPLGWIPQASNWKWMSDAAMSFANAVATSKVSLDNKTMSRK